MSIKINIEAVSTLGAELDAGQLAANPGFGSYWRELGADPVQVAEALCTGSTGNFPGAREVSSAMSTVVNQPTWSEILNVLGRISGVSIEQLLLRHLPEQASIDAHVYFIPGGSSVLVQRDQLLAVNVFNLEQTNKKLHLGGVPLLSVLTNLIHRVATAKFSPVPGNSRQQVLAEFFARLLREGAATLFFTTPTSGPIQQQWAQAEQRREQDFASLRKLMADIHTQPGQLAADLTRQFSESGPGAETARFPLGTYMCQVIESAFGRGRLVELLATPAQFDKAYEEARTKFSLPMKYALTE